MTGGRALMRAVHAAAVSRMILSILLLTQLASAYVPGDRLPVSIKALVDGLEGDWTGIPQRYAPVFGIDSHVNLAKRAYADIVEHGNPFQLLFRFDGNSKLATTWIPVFEGTRRVNHLQFTFMYSAGELRNMVCEPDFDDEAEHQGRSARDLTLYYRWVDVGNADISAGLAVLLGGSVLLGWGSIIASLFSSTGSKQETRQHRFPLLAFFDLLRGPRKTSGKGPTPDLEDGSQPHEVSFRDRDDKND